MANQSPMEVALKKMMHRHLSNGIRYEGDIEEMPELPVKLAALYDKCMHPNVNLSETYQVADVSTHLTLIAVEHEEVKDDASALRDALLDIEAEMGEGEVNEGYYTMHAMASVHTLTQRHPM